jgi:hypothetical protein
MYLEDEGNALLSSDSFKGTGEGAVLEASLGTSLPPHADPPNRRPETHGEGEEKKTEQHVRGGRERAGSEAGSDGVKGGQRTGSGGARKKKKKPKKKRGR